MFLKTTEIQPGLKSLREEHQGCNQPLQVFRTQGGGGTSGIFRARHCETTKRAGAGQNIEKLEKL